MNAKICTLDILLVYLRAGQVRKLNKSISSKISCILVGRNNTSWSLSNTDLELITSFAIATKEESQRTMMVLLFSRLLYLSKSVYGIGWPFFSRHTQYRQENLNPSTIPAFWSSCNDWSRWLSSCETMNAALSKKNARRSLWSTFLWLKMVCRGGGCDWVSSTQVVKLVRKEENLDRKTWALLISRCGISDSLIWFYFEEQIQEAILCDIKLCHPPSLSFNLRSTITGSCWHLCKFSIQFCWRKHILAVRVNETTKSLFGRPIRSIQTIAFCQVLLGFNQPRPTGRNRERYSRQTCGIHRLIQPRRGLSLTF